MEVEYWTAKWTKHAVAVADQNWIAGPIRA